MNPEQQAVSRPINMARPSHIVGFHLLMAILERECLKMEEWKPIVGWEGLYDVSDMGRVYSRISSKVLSHWFHRAGYPLVGLYRKGKMLRLKVHALVLTAFVGPRPEGMECRHLNGKPEDNRLCNLKWGTHKENMRDMWKLRQLGPMTKLTPHDVVHIRWLRRKGVLCSAIAKQYDIGHKAVRRAADGRTWGWVPVFWKEPNHARP